MEELGNAVGGSHDFRTQIAPAEQMKSRGQNRRAEEKRGGQGQRALPCERRSAGDHQRPAPGAPTDPQQPVGGSPSEAVARGSS